MQLESWRLLPLTLPRVLLVPQLTPQYSGQVSDFKDGAGEGNRTLVISLENSDAGSWATFPLSQMVRRDTA